MITYVPQHDGIYLGTIVQEGQTTFPIYPYFSYIFDPVPLLKGVQIQEGSLQSGPYALGASIWGSSWCLLLSEGSWLPSLMLSPPSCLTVSYSGSLYKRAIVDEMFWAATMVAAFLICLGIFHWPCQMNHELLCHPINSTGIITLGIVIITSILFF